MHKITKKLFGYFTILLVFFAVTAFLGFWGVFRHFTFEHLTNELTDRALVIRNQLEQFLDTTPGSSHGQGQGRGAYLRFVNDIAMADAYILDADGNPFSYGRQGSAGNIPTDEILEFARPVFTEGTTQSARRKSADGHKIFYVGMPVFQNGQVFLAVIIRDTADSNQESFLLAISILGICLLLVLFVSGFLSFLLSRRFIQPIQQIACTAKELANGNYQAKTNVQDPTELGGLADEMDLLAKKLEQARQESSKLEQMQKDYEQTAKSLKEVKEKVKEKRLYVTNHYGTYLGKEFMSPQKVAELYKIVESGTASSVSESIGVYQNQKK